MNKRKKIIFETVERIIENRCCPCPNENKPRPGATPNEYRAEKKKAETKTETLLSKLD